MRRLSFIVMLLFLTAIVSSCQAEQDNVDGKESLSADFQDKTVIMISVSNERLTPSMISQFETLNPEISIQRVEPKPYFMTNVEKSFEQLDIISIAEEDIPYYVKKGLALNLSSYLKDSALMKQDIYPHVLEMLRFDDHYNQGKGDYFAFLQGWSPGYMLVYNKTLFAAAGVKELDEHKALTWDELLELAKKLTLSREDQTKQYGFGITGKKMFDYSTYMLQMAQLSKSPWYDDFNKADFTNAQSQEIFEYWNETIQANIGPNPRNQITQMPEQLFASNQLAILMVDYGTAQHMASLLDNSDMKDYGIAPIPNFGDGTEVIPILTSSAAIINANSKHKDEAWEVFQWFFAGDHAEILTREGKELPIYPSKLSLLPKESTWSAKLAAYAERQIPKSRPLLQYNAFLTSASVNNIFDKNLVPAYFAKSDLMMALYRMTQEVNFQIEDSKLILSKQQ